ncbi:MAG: hypothetical protein HYZ87_00710 [Candidatus Omnitrophica bacterium]|nr:hypothetical protein [Candidatus Omnitrophota bacterium]
MKKTMALVLSFMMISTYALAAVVDGSPDARRRARRSEVKVIKERMREERKSAGPKGPSAWSSFWKKEGVRSGVSNTGTAVSDFAKKMNPAPFFKDQNEKYKARKAAQSASS